MLVKLSSCQLKAGRAYIIKLALQDVFVAANREDGEARLKRWYNWAIRSQMEQIKKVARTVKNHWNGVLAWFDSKLTNALLAAVNGLIQSATSRARGYRSIKTLINIAYPLDGTLDFIITT